MAAHLKMLINIQYVLVIDLVMVSLDVLVFTVAVIVSVYVLPCVTSFAVFDTISIELPDERFSHFSTTVPLLSDKVNVPSVILVTPLPPLI